MNRLYELRKESNLTLRELANYVDIAFTSLQLLEKGEKQFRQEHLDKLSQFFNVSKEYLLGDTDFYIGVRCDDDPKLETNIYKSTYDNFIKNRQVNITIKECNIEILLKGPKKEESVYYLRHNVYRLVKGVNRKMINALKSEINIKLDSMDIDKLRKLNKFIDDFMK